jgi:hypothetical protein
MTDAFGRHYLEVGPFAPDLARHFEGLSPDPCVDCGKPIYHGRERYFQRAEHDCTCRHTFKFVVRDINCPIHGDPLGTLGSVDLVCETCGHDALGHPKS